jgi:hypothetical protein
MDQAVIFTTSLAAAEAYSAQIDAMPGSPAFPGTEALPWPDGAGGQTTTLSRIITHPDGDKWAYLVIPLNLAYVQSTSATIEEIDLEGEWEPPHEDF